MVGDALVDSYAALASVDDYRSHSAQEVHEIGHIQLGGAANTVRELVRLGHSVTWVSRQQLPLHLADSGILAASRFSLGHDPLPMRTWVELRNGTSLRLDGHFQNSEPVHETIIPTVVDRIRGAELIIVNDYGFGSASDVVRTADNELDRVLWDPHVRGSTPPRGLRALLPNVRAAQVLAGQKPEARLTATKAALLASLLYEQYNPAVVAVTAGGLGAIAMIRDRGLHYSPSQHLPDAHPAVERGAGDLFLAHFAHRLTKKDSCQQALDAAAWDTSERLTEEGIFGYQRNGALDTRQAALLTVVAVGGCFDIIHPGHIHLLQNAARLGDQVVVFMNNDDSVRRLKGPGRPVFNQDTRTRNLIATGLVDEVVPFSEDNPSETIRRFRPKIFVKGADYKPIELPEYDSASDVDCQIVTIPLLVGHTTSSIIGRIRGGS